MNKTDRVLVLKPAKDPAERRMASCGLVALVVKVPVKAC